MWWSGALLSWRGRPQRSRATRITIALAERRPKVARHLILRRARRQKRQQAPTDAAAVPDTATHARCALRAARMPIAPSCTNVTLQVGARIRLRGSNFIRENATNAVALSHARKLLVSTFLVSRRGSAIRRRASERLALLLMQEGGGDTRSSELTARNLLRFDLECTHTLSRQVLAYPRSTPPRLVVPVCFGPPLVFAMDGALPRGTLRQLQRVFAPHSPFWSAHGYRAGEHASPFFSYAHTIATKSDVKSGKSDVGRRACGSAEASRWSTPHALDRLVAHLLRVLTPREPRLRRARYAEWWAHCRPHHTGHQLHFDSHNEGEGAQGPKHPLVSSVLYLSGGAGGPTLVTDQHALANAETLAGGGWAAMPRQNRLLAFDGNLLHCVVPGRGVPPRDREGALIPRISLMVAFWERLEVQPGDQPGAARPFPYGSSLASLLDWPAQKDGGPYPAAPPSPVPLTSPVPLSPSAAQPSTSPPSRPRFGLAATDAGLADLLERSRAIARLKAEARVKAGASSGRAVRTLDPNPIPGVSRRDPVWRVEPIWNRVRDSKAATGELLPPYERCFQGF